MNLDGDDELPALKAKPIRQPHTLSWCRGSIFAVLELYWDKPKELWTYKEDGSLEMFTKQLDLENLLEELIQE